MSPAFRRDSTSPAEPVSESPERILVIHSSPDVRSALVSGLRAVSERPLAIYETETLADGVGRLDGLEPEKVFLELTADFELALDALVEMQAPGRNLFGLYDPLVGEGAGEELFRRTVRAGADDFLALPVSREELADLLRARDVDRGTERPPGRVLAFYGAKGGVGTTTVACNLGLVLAGGGALEHVALCDGALQFGTAAEVLGLSGEMDVGDLVRDLGREDVLSAYLTRHELTGLRLLQRPRSIDVAEAIRPEDLSRVLLTLRSRFEYVLVDTASALDQVTLATLDLADHVFLVLEGLTPSLRATRSGLEVLGRLGFDEDRVSILLNRAGSFEGALGRRTVELELGRPVFAELPQHKDVVKASNNGAPLVIDKQRNPFSVAIGSLADRLLERVPPRRRHEARS